MISTRSINSDLTLIHRLKRCFGHNPFHSSKELASTPQRLCLVALDVKLEQHGTLHLNCAQHLIQGGLSHRNPLQFHGSRESRAMGRGQRQKGTGMAV